MFLFTYLRMKISIFCINYLKNSIIFKNTPIIELIKHYVSAFDNSSKPCKKKIHYVVYEMNTANG